MLQVTPETVPLPTKKDSVPRQVTEREYALSPPEAHREAHLARFDEMPPAGWDVEHLARLEDEVNVGCGPEERVGLGIDGIGVDDSATHLGGRGRMGRVGGRGRMGRVGGRGSVRGRGDGGLETEANMRALPDLKNRLEEQT